VQLPSRPIGLCDHRIDLYSITAGIGPIVLTHNTDQTRDVTFQQVIRLITVIIKLYSSSLGTYCPSHSYSEG